MVINEDLFQKRCKQKKSYLVYLVTSCEMGSEGWSGWDYYAVAHGSTEEEIYNDWIEQCKIMVLVNNCVGDFVWRFMQSLESLYL